MGAKAKRAGAGSEEFGRRLKLAMKSRGISGAELARRMDVSENAVSTWTNGKSGPEFENLIQLIQVLGASPQELLGGSVGKATPSDRLVVELAELGVAGRVRDLSALGPKFLKALEQLEARAEELNRRR